LSLAAGLAGFTKVFTAQRAAEFHATAEGFKAELGWRMKQTGLPVQFTGHGSMLSAHVGERAPTCVAEISPNSYRLRRLVHLHLVETGVLISGRGDVYSITLEMCPQSGSVKSLVDCND
jgi:glutamate-1-semialdehyde 2,1-aminomutase